MKANQEQIPFSIKSLHKYSILTIMLENAGSEKLLGVTIDGKLNYEF